MSSNLISRRKAINAVYGMARPTGIDELPYEYAEDVINNLPSADIMECARAIKEYCVNRVSHNPTMCDKCPIYKVMCEPDISCPYHWDLPEGEKGGE